MNSPFGFLIPPAAPLAPPDLQVQSISANQLAYTIPASAIRSHLAVFLLPGQTLPPGAAAALYIRLPGPGAEFKFLGALGAGKASAIFRVAGIGGTAASASASAPEVDMDAEGGAQAETGGQEEVVTIGISLEAADEVRAKMEANEARGGGAAAAAAAVSDDASGTAVVRRADAARQPGGQGPGTRVLAQRIIQNAFNFLASFEGGNGMVPIKAFEAWWQKFERRVQNDPGFLEREQD